MTGIHLQLASRHIDSMSGCLYGCCTCRNVTTAKCTEKEERTGQKFDELVTLTPSCHGAKKGECISITICEPVCCTNPDTGPGMYLQKPQELCVLLLRLHEMKLQQYLLQWLAVFCSLPRCTKKVFPSLFWITMPSQLYFAQTADIFIQIPIITISRNPS